MELKPRGRRRSCTLPGRSAVAASWYQSQRPQISANSRRALRYATPRVPAGRSVSFRGTGIAGLEPRRKSLTVIGLREIGFVSLFFSRSSSVMSVSAVSPFRIATGVKFLRWWMNERPWIWRATNRLHEGEECARPPRFALRVLARRGTLRACATNGETARKSACATKANGRRSRQTAAEACATKLRVEVHARRFVPATEVTGNLDRGLPSAAPLVSCGRAMSRKRDRVGLSSNVPASDT